MCKTYKAPKSEIDLKLSVFSPVNPRQKKDKIPDRNDDSGWRKLNTTITSGKKHIKSCPMCFRHFQSEHAYQIHIQKHKPQCVHCFIRLKSWKQYLKHLPYCRKRAVDRVPRRLYQPEKKPKLKFTCQLCKRIYRKEEHLRYHQINTCEKRYLSNGWIVKI